MTEQVKDSTHVALVAWVAVAVLVGLGTVWYAIYDTNVRIDQHQQYLQYEQYLKKHKNCSCHRERLV